MIVEEANPPQFRVWLDAHIRRAEAQADYVIVEADWQPYLQGSEQFKQFIKDATKISNAAVRVLLQFFSRMMEGESTCQHRCRCWRGMRLLIEKMIVDREAHTNYPHEQLLTVVISRLARYQDIRKSQSAVDRLEQKNILAVYLGLLCLKDTLPSRILELTYILTQTEPVAEVLNSQLFKLDEWLQCKTLQFSDSLTLFNIITRGALREQLTKNAYNFAGVKFYLRSLLPSLLRSLFSQQGEQRDLFLIALTHELNDEEVLLEVYLEHLNRQQSQPVIACILRYVSWQMAQCISVKKVKLLLKNLKMEAPQPEQATVQLQKLKSYVDLLKDISRRYPEPCMTIQFNSPSCCFSLQNFVKDKSIVVCFQVDVKTLVQTACLFAVGHKKGLIEFILEPHRSTELVRVSMIVKLGDRVLIKQSIHNNWKPMSEFVVSMCNNGDHLTVFVNSVSFIVNETSDLSKFQFGAASTGSFIGKLKGFVIFAPEVKVEELYKEWMNCEGRLQAFLRQRKPEDIICKMSRGETLFRFTNKEKGFFSKLFTKEPKHTLTGGAAAVFMPSMLQIIQQLGHLDCLLYFIEYINGLVPDNPEVPQILSGLFSILKIICVNDEFYEALDWIENSLSNLAHLLWLLFIRNGQAPLSVRLVLKIFDFLLYFERRLKYEKNDEALTTCYRNLECGVIRVVLLKFDVWMMCGLTEQKFVLKVIQKRLEDPSILRNFTQANCLSHILMSLLVHYNPNFHLENKILTQQAIFDLQEAIVNICGQLMKDDSPHIERDFKTLLTYTYVSQDVSLEFNCPSIFKKLLRLLLKNVLPLRSIVKYLMNGANSSIAQRMVYFFCRIIKGATTLENVQIIIEIIFNLIGMLPDHMHENAIQAILVSLSSRSRDTGFSIIPYIQLLKNLANSQLSGLANHLSRVITGMRKCYKLVGRLESIENLEDSVMNLPQEVLLPFINSDQGFDFLLTISIEQPEHQQRITTMFENLFVYCYSSTEPQKGLPFIRNFLKVFDKVKLHSTAPPSTLHLLCEYIDSKYLIKVLHSNKLIWSQQPLSFITAKEQVGEYPGGVFGHLLSRNSFSEDDIDIIKSLITKRARNIEKYYGQEDLIDYLLPDIVFLEILWTLLRKHMGDLQKKMSELKSSRKLSSSSDSKENTPIKHAPTELEPDAERLLRMMKEVLEHESIITNNAVFSQFETILATFYDTLNKEQSRDLLLSAYTQLNFKLESGMHTVISQDPLPNQLLTQLKQQLKNPNLSDTFDFVYQNRKSFEELLKSMNRYCKKDVTVFRKICYPPLRPQLELPQPLPSPSQLPDYREQFTNQFVSQLEEIFKYQLGKLDISSETSEELWKNLNNRNRFWLWDKKSENDIYKMDLHESPNFYHLNIKKVEAGHRVQYTRRNQASMTTLPVWDKKYQRSAIMTASSVIEIRDRKLTESAAKLPQPQVASKNGKIKYFAEYVTQQGVYFGMVYVKDDCLKFKSLKDSDRPPAKQYQYSTSEFHRLENQKQKSLPLAEAVLFTRRYVMRHTAIELFTRNKGYFFNLFNEDKRRQLLAELKDLLHVCIINRKQQFAKQDYTKKWINGEYNNFEYLMLLNRYSGRTYNDLSQFPVFPWVIANYGKEPKQITKDFYRNPNNLRNMELPVGRLNQTRFEGYQVRIQECDDPDQHFLYGSFYSNPTFIYNFFIRLEPFTTLHWQHQGKKIDHADRLFSGIEEQYRSATTNTSDVRELIPEFYYWPEFLRNRNQIELGKKQNKEEVSDAKLPGWACTPEQFIFKMRQALESQQITEQLSCWIDLIFGYKSCKEEAERYDNLFHPYTYEQDIFKLDDLDTIQMAQLNITEFGQIPQQLFTKEHPRKKPRHGIMVDHYRQIYSQPGALRFQLSTQGVVLISNKQLTFLSTNFSIVSKADGKSCETVSANCTMVSEKELSWVTTLDNHLYLYKNRKLKGKQLKLESDIYLLTSKHLLIRPQGSQLVVQKLKLAVTDQLEKPQKLFGHQQNIYMICANENADVLLSLDRDNLVLLHYISTLKYLRTFKLSLNLGETVLQLRIHDMGYFVFLTSESRLLIYTFVGELFAHSDLSSDIDGERATNLQFLSQWQSQIVTSHITQLLSTNCGSIYQLDFFELWRFKADFAHLPFRLRPKRNILYRCREDSNKDTQYKDAQRQQILHFELLKSSNESKVLFKVLVLYRDGQLLCFYEKEMMKEHIQNSPLLKQMGIV